VDGYRFSLMIGTDPQSDLGFVVSGCPLHDQGCFADPGVAEYHHFAARAADSVHRRFSFELFD
jgi:hypothetical protein